MDRDFMQEPTQLLDNATVTGPQFTGMRGGSYVWNVVGTFGGATVNLQALGADKTTWLTVASMAAPGTLGVVLGHRSTIRAQVVGGAPVALYSSIS